MTSRFGSFSGSSRALPLRRAAASLLLAGAAALALPACQSAITQDYGNPASDRYYESLVAREIVRGTYGEKALAAGTGPTLIGGVHEIVPVDSPGPDTAPANYPPPMTNPSLATAGQIGRDAAALHMDEPVVGLSLQEAIARAVQHSLAIKVEAYNPAINEAKVIEADAGTFDPVFFGQSQWANNDNPSASSPNYSNGEVWSNNLGIKKVLPIGTQIQATSNITMNDFALPKGTLASSTTQSSYATNVNIQLTQPLLKGFGTAVNQANIYLAQRDLRTSQAAFRLKVMSTVADVEEAYHTLVLDRTNVEIEQRLVVASEQTYKDVYARRIVDATTASVNQALSALESRRADLLVAQKTYRQQSDKLKALVNDPELDVDSNVLINPTDRPPVEAMHYGTLECIETALRQRPEMQEARMQLEKADIVLTVAKNDLLPQVDLTLAMQPNGLARGLGDSWVNSIDPMNAVDYSVGIKFSMPIGNRAAETALERHQNERRQAIAQLVSDAKQIVQNVKQELREVESTYEEITIRDQVRVAAANEFQGIIDIENIRQRTPEFLQLKLDSQANLAQAEQLLVQAITNYNIAIMRLEAAKGTLLEYDRISLDKAPKAPPEEPLDILRLHARMDLSKPPKP